MWKTPVSCADNGKLEQSECLITEKAVSEYNGTVCDKITDPENPTDVYPITNLGDTTCVHGSIEVECNVDVHNDIVNTADHCVCVGDKLIAKCGIISDSDVHISGDLYVDGTSHIVQTETVATKDNTVVLRQNATGGISSGEVSGLVINKYNGTDSLSLVTDCSGTLRIGTGTGVETCYPTICYNNTDGNWYINDVVTPITGNLTSYATKNEDAPYTIYTDAVFTVIDETTLEPLMTRDEASNMTDKGLVYWDATEVEGKTSCCFTIEDNGNQLVGGNSIVLDADQEAIAATNISGTNVCGDCVTVNRNLIQTDTNGCMFICGDLYVCGTTNIHGDVAGQVITQCNNNLDGFVSFVQCNHSNPSYSCVYTDECLKYNSASHILTVPTVCGNLCGTATCAYCNGSGTAFGTAATKNTGTAAGCIPIVGTALGTTNGQFVATDANGCLKPSGYTASCFRASSWTPSCVSCSGAVLTCGSTQAYLFDVKLTNGITTQYQFDWVSATCRLQFCSTTGVLYAKCFCGIASNADALSGFGVSADATNNSVGLRTSQGFFNAKIFHDEWNAEDIRNYSSPKLVFKGNGDGYLRNTDPAYVTVGCATCAGVANAKYCAAAVYVCFKCMCNLGGNCFYDVYVCSRTGTDVLVAGPISTAYVCCCSGLLYGKVVYSNYTQCIGCANGKGLSSYCLSGVLLG